MSNEALTVLLVEDNPLDATLVRKHLSDVTHPQFELTSVETLADALRLLDRQAFDVGLIDLHLPDSCGLDTFRQVCPINAVTAVVVLTGLSDEEIGVQAVREGAADFLVKGQITKHLLVRSIRYAIERKRTELATNHLATLVESSEDAILSETLDGIISSWNPGAQRLFGYSALEVVGRSISLLIPPDRAQELEWILATIRRGDRVRPFETVRVRKDGGFVDISLSVAPIRAPNGQITGASVIAQDRTAHKRLEAQLRQAQKMEAVGRLAGGVAHDFNNLMTTVIGFSDLLINQQYEMAPSRELLRVIKRAGERAADLTQKMLAFSRRQILTFKVVDLNAILRGMESTLRSVLSENIELITDLDPALGAVRTDPDQIEEVILNLTVNARDAMPSGGRLTLQTVNVELPGDADTGVAPGPYVRLKVSDTGCGMDAQMKEHLFEPFFTTKEVGKGTGLGLAACYGTIKQSGGHITCDSWPDHGTTFEIYLPRLGDAPGAALAGSPREETILVVEEEDGVRGLIRYVLASSGYQVLEARSSYEALSIVRQYQGEIALLITDTNLPRLSGREMVEQIVAILPNIKILFISGYADEETLQTELSSKARHFLAKPFVPPMLVQKVREILE